MVRSPRSLKPWPCARPSRKRWAGPTRPKRWKARPASIMRPPEPAAPAGEKPARRKMDLATGEGHRPDRQATTRTASTTQRRRRPDQAQRSRVRRRRWLAQRTRRRRRTRQRRAVRQGPRAGVIDRGSAERRDAAGSSPRHDDGLHRRAARDRGRRRDAGLLSAAALVKITTKTPRAQRPRPKRRRDGEIMADQEEEQDRRSAKASRRPIWLSFWTVSRWHVANSRWPRDWA